MNETLLATTASGISQYALHAADTQAAVTNPRTVDT
jgi:hypothetical protein